jgi:hypothetical protein
MKLRLRHLIQLNTEWPARYDAEGNFIYPEGFDAETQEWKPGFEAQREEWERQYAEAQDTLSWLTRSRRLRPRPLKLLQLLQRKQFLQSRNICVKKASRNCGAFFHLTSRVSLCELSD